MHATLTGNGKVMLTKALMLFLLSRTAIMVVCTTRCVVGVYKMYFMLSIMQWLLLLSRLHVVLLSCTLLLSFWGSIPVEVNLNTPRKDIRERTWPTLE